jgi:hypothetical protein
VIGGDAIHFARLFRYPAKEISATDDDRDLHAEGVDVGKFRGDLVDAKWIDSEALVCGKCFTGKFE